MWTFRGQEHCAKPVRSKETLIFQQNKIDFSIVTKQWTQTELRKAEYNEQIFLIAVQEATKVLWTQMEICL